MVRPRIAPLSMPCSFAYVSAGAAQLIGRAGFLFCRRADESELLDPRDIVRIRAMQIGTGHFLLVELDQDALAACACSSKIFIFFLGAVAPENIFRLGQPRDFLDPIEHRLVGRFRIANSARRRNGWREIVHDGQARRRRRTVDFRRFVQLLQANFYAQELARTALARRRA